MSKYVRIKDLVSKIDNSDISEEYRAKFESAYGILLKAFKLESKNRDICITNVPIVNKNNDIIEHESKFCKQFFRILVVDDEVEILETYKMQLQSLGFSDIIKTDSMKLARELIKSDDFNLVISDYNFNNSLYGEGMFNGEDFFREYKKLKKSGVFILVSGEDLSQDDMAKKGVLVVHKLDWMIKCNVIVADIYKKTLMNYLKRVE